MTLLVAEECCAVLSLQAITEPGRLGFVVVVAKSAAGGAAGVAATAALMRAASACAVEAVSVSDSRAA